MRRFLDHLTEFSQKKVLIRANYDVPIDAGRLIDTTRIEASLEVIAKTLEANAKVILIAHQDRPNGYNPENSLAPVRDFLQAKIGQNVDLIPFVEDYSKLSVNPQANITLIDNLRFWPQEESNDSGFSKYLAGLADIYVNEAFANCHRSHASIVGIPSIIKGYAGPELAKEIDILSKMTSHPEKPLVVVIGGAKLETKEPLVAAFKEIADQILVGGKVALDLKSHSSLPNNVILADLTPDGKDITENSALSFAGYIKNAKSVVWNGSMGIFEEPDHQLGTKIVAQAMNETPAFTLVGGGDTETALTQLGLESGIDYISTGGGAMLTYLSEGTLVALKSLED